ncbi:MAG: hypothetical protein GY773_06120 [Actinomycetia bacterium]|nr:hypothetical protein [Actinomycetes bacterium]MCP5033923.1 hypothetical protein [Actinomycetes bacterium]
MADSETAASGRQHDLVDLEDPASYPPGDSLTQACDLVMKGGLTSGVIYPHTVCHLATTRRIRKVGGTSAGAIAAGGAAAAERGRTSGGFAELARLPSQLVETSGGRHTLMYHLFQAQDATRALYRFMAIWVSRGSMASKIAGALVAGIRLLRPVPFIFLVEVPILLLIGAIVQGGWMGITASLILAGTGLPLAIAISLVIRLLRDLPRNGFGLCSGMEGKGHQGQPPLTQWLADRYDTIAGVTNPSTPVTFGDLADSEVELSMLTTDLTLTTQNSLPFKARIWAFSPKEFRRLFPERIVDWMVNHPPSVRNGVDQRVFDRFREQGLEPLPDERDLPLVVGVRMSLSFPVLLSTVPLYAVDYTHRPPQLVKHYFSDGGITSNLPLQFFDEAIPEHPTFAIDLMVTEDLDADDHQNVTMAEGNRSGTLARPTKIETTVDFALAVKNGLQNWADAMQTHVPGYRDRIIAVKHTKAEGGLNLDMDADVVLDLVARGRCAGVEAEEFDFANHRWIRMRSFFHLLEQLILPAATSLRAPRSEDGPPTYREMIDGPPPSSYRRAWNAGAGYRVTDAIEQLADTFSAEAEAHGGSRFEQGAPAPHPELQIRPKPR